MSTASLVQSVVRLGDVAPNFEADSTEGKLDLYKYQGSKWLVFFSHPADFTPVCTTELGRVAQLKGEFDKRNAQVVALSCDTVENHHAWIKDIEDIQKVKINYPIIADPSRKIACLYGMLDQNYLDQSGIPLTVRSVFIIDPDHKLRLSITYPASTGRNFNEILRVLDSVQLASTHKVATPADWEKGKDTVVLASIKTEDAEKIFTKGLNVIRPWLRTTPDPSA